MLFNTFAIIFNGCLDIAPKSLHDFFTSAGSTTILKINAFCYPIA